MLQRRYHILIKIKSWHRAAKLARSVSEWYADTKVADRQVGWVREPFVFAQPTRQLPIRTPRPKGGWHYQVLVFAMNCAMLFELCNRPMPNTLSDLDLLLAALHAYDLRDGGLETQNKGDKQGLGFEHYGMVRMVRDVLQIDGTIHWDAAGDICAIDLNARHPLANVVQHAIVLGNSSVNLRKN